MNEQLRCRVIQVTEKLRQTYGDNKQLAVSAEELSELTGAILKHVRYDNKDEAVAALYQKVLDEYVDVNIILNHIKSIFRLKDEDIDARMSAKLDRMERWVNTSNSMEQTTKDRAVIIEKEPVVPVNDSQSFKTLNGDMCPMDCPRYKNAPCVVCFKEVIPKSYPFGHECSENCFYAHNRLECPKDCPVYLKPSKK